MPTRLELVRGTDRDHERQATLDGTTPITSLLASDALSGRVWRGDSQAVLLAPAVSWVDAPTARFRISLYAADSAALEYGTYRYQVLVSRGGRSAVLDDGELEILPAPGLDTPPPVYCQYSDMLDKAPWVAQCQDPEKGTEGFLKARANARKIHDMRIAKAFRGTSIGLFGTQSGAAFAWAGGGPRRSLIPSKLILDYLAAGYLMLDEPTVRINTYLAIAEVGLGQIGTNNTFAGYGAMFQSRADALYSGYTALLDINGDGYAEIPVPLGATNTLFT